MSVTHDQLNDFHHFALARLGDGGAESITELAQQWQAVHEWQGVNQALRKPTSPNQVAFRPIVIRGLPLSSTVLAERR